MEKQTQVRYNYQGESSFSNQYILTLLEKMYPGMDKKVLSQEVYDNSLVEGTKKNFNLDASKLKYKEVFKTQLENYMEIAQWHCYLQSKPKKYVEHVQKISQNSEIPIMLETSTFKQKDTDKILVVNKVTLDHLRKQFLVAKNDESVFSADEMKEAKQAYLQLQKRKEEQEKNTANEAKEDQVDIIANEAKEFYFFDDVWRHIADELTTEEINLLIEDLVFYSIQHPFGVYGYWLIDNLQKLTEKNKAKLSSLFFEHTTTSLVVGQKYRVDEQLIRAMKESKVINFRHLSLKHKKIVDVEQFIPVVIVNNWRTDQMHLIGISMKDEHNTKISPQNPEMRIIPLEGVDLMSVNIVENPSWEAAKSLKEMKEEILKVSREAFALPKYDLKAASDKVELIFTCPSHLLLEQLEKRVAYLFGNQEMTTTITRDEKNQQITLEFETQNYGEIIPWIRSFGRNCQIIGPQKLKDEFKKRLQEAMKDGN